MCVLVLDIDAENYRELDKTFAFAVTDDYSWFRPERKDDGFLRLLRELNIDLPDDSSIQCLTPVVKNEIRTLSGFFKDYAQESHDNIVRDEILPSIVILNFMPFFLNPAHMDKILGGLFSNWDGFELFRNCMLVLLTRNTDWVLGSNIFIKDIFEAGKLRAGFATADIRGYAAIFWERSQSGVYSFNREAFGELLNVEESRIYKSLVFGTNTHLGHFGLTNAHVRTHYDLNEFIEKDAIWEYFFTKLRGMVGEETVKLLLIGTGIEQAVIFRIGEQFKATSTGSNFFVEFKPRPTGSPVFSDHDWSERYDMAIIFTDIVCTGKTLEKHARALIDSNRLDKPVKLFTVARMRNSPSHLGNMKLKYESGIEIQRDYYAPNVDECRLCKLKQPVISVENAGQFQQVHSAQPTPLDFWEMVVDSDALTVETEDPQGRIFLYRIDTTRLIKKYKRWLQNVVRKKYEDAWVDINVDCICTVEEPPSKGFSVLVAETLHIDTTKRISRDDLRRVVRVGGLPDDVVNHLASYSNILIVDDGANFGTTLLQLIGYCKSAGKYPIGALILDSRLNQDQIYRIKKEMDKRPLVSIYDWPAGHQVLTVNKE